MTAIVLSRFQAGPLLAARQTGTDTTETSLDPAAHSSKGVRADGGT